jgi:hypothetical protein
MVTIQTFDGETWEDCEHKSWQELIDDGWEFRGLTQDGDAVMSRRGYINLFRNWKSLEARLRLKGLTTT